MAKEAYYFSHDANARQDPKISEMMSVYGIQGYGRYWILVEMLREQANFTLKVNGKYTFNALAMQMHCKADEAEQFLHDCIYEFELFESDGERFWSNSLIRRMAIKEEISMKRKQAAEARWGKNRDKSTSEDKTDTNDMQMHNTSIAIGMQGKEKKVNESKEKESNKDIVADALPYKEVIDYLNVSASTQFRSNGKKTQSVIKARFNEGFTLDDFKTVIDKKTADWLNDEKWSKFLRPETLFGNKFEGYLNEKRGGSRETFKQPVARTNDTSGLDW